MATIERHVTREVIALEDSQPCSEAARLMSERKIGSIAVRRGGRIVGLVTERDLVERLVARGRPASLSLAETMRTDLPVVSVETNEREVSDLMKQCATRHLLVSSGGEVCGVISMRDVIQLMVDDKQYLIDQLRSYIEGR